MTDKLSIRKKMSDQRRVYSAAERNNAAIAAAALFKKSPLFLNSSNIACYYSLSKEFPTHEIINEIWVENKNCYLPVVQTKEKTLSFASYNKNEELILNSHHILEPLSTAVFCSLEKLDIVILPLLAFDHQGNRLGTGGGYYDRTFSFRKNSAIKKPLLIGLGYASQEVASLPEDEWDIKLDGILTEEKLIFFRSPD
ncbi:MAG: 5-formyltetrahydrofolate cyclo-ligase [Gammaproteobacteria bacterium]|nr:5-formyltetrahydrofolate cyclo-ligase [Gammaproteobacteria bacterium]